MTVATRGEKRLCLNCAAKFFDLAQDPIKCPQCGATFEPVVLARSPPRRMGRPFGSPAFETQGVVATAAEESVKASEDAQDEDEDETPAAAESDAAV